MSIRPFRAALGLAGCAVAVTLVGMLAVGAQTPHSFTQQAPAPTYKLTIVARTCPAYTDIAANRARNNSMESLRDLGRDTPYRQGTPIQPDIETPTHPNCRPLVNWQVQTGNDFNGRVDGLTVVSGPDPAGPATLASTPELDRLGNPTGRSLAGAVTVTLTAEQVARAAKGDYIAQGGTVTEPLLGGRIPGGGAFGILRCAYDNNNGDNVEYVQFSQGDRHVFCYAYYIDTKVPDGEIVIRKEGPAGAQYTERFGFGGNVSYQPGGRFNLTMDEGQPVETRFLRAATRPGDPLWEVTEDQLPSGWTLTSLSCTAPGGSVTTVTGAKVTVNLVADDTVTCTYVNQPPPVSGLVVRKLTEGGVGRFDFTVVGPSTAPETKTFTLETTQPGVEVSSNPFTGLTPGEYTITEVLPDGGAAGRWRLSDAECGGIDQPQNGAGTGITITLPPDGNADCHFDNTFTPTGRLSLRLTTLGGTGTSSFAVTTADPNVPIKPGEPDGAALLTATTAQPGVAVDATGDPLDALDVGQRYVVIAQRPETTEQGSWQLRTLHCYAAGQNQAPPRPPTGDIVEATIDAPGYHTICDFVYELVPPGTLQVRKHADGPAGTRSAPAIIDIRCANTAAGQVVLDADKPGPEPLPEAIRAVDATTCTLGESATGAAPGAGHQLRAVVARNGVVVGGDWQSLALEPGVATEVELFNTYTPPSPPTTKPPGGGGRGGRLPKTGGDIGGLLIAGLACLAVGASCRAIARRSD